MDPRSRPHSRARCDGAGRWTFRRRGTRNRRRSMSAFALSGAAATAAADAVVEDLIRAAVAGTGLARLTNAPAGAGKTGAGLPLVGALATAGARSGRAPQKQDPAIAPGAL